MTVYRRRCCNWVTLTALPVCWSTKTRSPKRRLKLDGDGLETVRIALAKRVGVGAHQDLDLFIRLQP